MITIDGLPITPELAHVLTQWSRVDTCNGNRANRYMGSCSEIQDYLCRKLSESDIEEKACIIDLIEEIMAMKDDMKCLSQLLPEIEE